MNYITYYSKRPSNSNETDINDILLQSNMNNNKSNISGVLLYSSDFFVQYIEGDKVEIFELFNKIKQDKRHIEVHLIETGEIENKIFPSWAMGNKKIDSTLEIKSEINDKKRSIFKELIEGKENTEKVSIKLLRKLIDLID